MEAVIDGAGRVVVPKQFRDALGLTPGTKVDISVYGRGVQITPGGRTARVERGEHGHHVIKGETVLTDDVLFALIDSGRK